MRRERAVRVMPLRSTAVVVISRGGGLRRLFNCYNIRRIREGGADDEARDETLQSYTSAVAAVVFPADVDRRASGEFHHRPARFGARAAFCRRARNRGGSEKIYPAHVALRLRCGRGGDGADGRAAYRRGFFARGRAAPVVRRALLPRHDEPVHQPRRPALDARLHIALRFHNLRAEL